MCYKGVMEKIIPIWKPIGLTPLKSIELFKLKNPIYADVTLSYAGRLDPMAEGILLLLVGDENKNREKYQGFSKEYISEIVLGITTDTFDAMGIIKEVGDGSPLLEKEVSRVINSFAGKQKQKYPAYSSKPVNGKPLYWWARQDRISEIAIPEKEIEIFSIDIRQKTTVSSQALVNEIIKRINLVDGDFRQDEIIEIWEKFGQDYQDTQFVKLEIKVTCSSGTYIRSLASDIGEKLGCGAFALSIKRTKVGDYSLGDSISV